MNKSVRLLLSVVVSGTLLLGATACSGTAGEATTRAASIKDQQADLNQIIKALPKASVVKVKVSPGDSKHKTGRYLPCDEKTQTQWVEGRTVFTKNLAVANQAFLKQQKTYFENHGYTTKWFSTGDDTKLILDKGSYEYWLGLSKVKVTDAKTQPSDQAFSVLGFGKCLVAKQGE